MMRRRMTLAVAGWLARWRLLAELARWVAVAACCVG